jgi:hypothetical protein
MLVIRTCLMFDEFEMVKFGFLGLFFGLELLANVLLV